MIEVQIHEARIKLIETGNKITNHDLKNAIIGCSDHSKMLLEIFEEHNKQWARSDAIRFIRTYKIRSF